jgi:hypothetical protein
VFLGSSAGFPSGLLAKVAQSMRRSLDARADAVKSFLKDADPRLDHGHFRGQ